MAKVYLPIEIGRTIVDLPPVCMKCGAPATVLKKKKFSYCPSWVGVLILLGLIGVVLYIVVASALTKRQTVETPLCERHQNYWWKYPLYMTLSFVGLISFGVLAMIVMSFATQGNRNSDGGLVGWTAGVTALSLVLLLIAAAIISSMRIRTTEITERYVRLAGVSPEFADAVEEDDYRQRSRFGRDDDYPREPRRQRDDDPRYMR
jgi:hypothetical protein